MKYFILSLLFLVIFSCSSKKNSDGYKIIKRGKDFVTLELQSRTSPENLWMYAEEVKEHEGTNLYNVAFMLPSEYPVNPDGVPWASVMYKPDGSSMLNIYGTRSDQHKKNLLALKFDSDHQIGKWYYQVPIYEKVIVIAELDGELVISEFTVKSVSQKSDAANNETKIADMTQSEFEQWDQYIELERNPENPNEFKIEGTEFWEYRIGKDKRLFFLDSEGKVYKEAIPVP